MPIQIENLSYRYNPKTPFEHVALLGISFTINDGDFFGIIGHTGSGKSTLINHLNGLTKLTSGSLIVDGMDLSKKYDYKKLRSTVGMVFQYPEYQLFDESVKSDVGFGPKNLKLSKDEIDLRVREAIALVGLDYDTIAERSPFELSGGQMRRVAIAGVLAMKPKILVLDEPTAGLDPTGKKHILQLIKSIKNECPTVIMISHNMDEIFSCCNRIALLNNGCLKGVFTPAELFNHRQLIEESGLELPSIFRLADSLTKKGYSFSDFDSEDALATQIAAQFKQKAAGSKTLLGAGRTDA